MNSLDDMQLFVEVVKQKSFIKAAQQLGLATSTVSQRIQKLEKKLNLQLLHRTTRRIELTETGRLYFDRASRIISDADVLHQSLERLLDRPVGTVRLSVPVDFAYQVLAPLILPFYQKFPDIRLEIDTSARLVDLLGEPFDAAVRTGRISDENLIARKLADYAFQLYAAPGYLTKYGTPETLDDLSSHRCLAFREHSWQLFDGNGKMHRVEFDGVLNSQSPGLVGRLCAQGLGIALLPDVIAKPFGLKRVLDNFSGEKTPVYAVTATKLLPAKVKVFVEFLQENMEFQAD